jgi:hypothetical protein
MADLSVKGISTYQTYLMYRTTTSGTFGKLIDITSFPDLIPPKERIDITSLSDYMRVYINGVGDTSEMSFGANYTPENYEAVTNLEGHVYEYAVWFGATGSAGSETPDGHMGKFTWTGDISAGISGGGVNEAVGMTINCTPATVIVFSTT